MALKKIQIFLYVRNGKIVWQEAQKAYLGMWLSAVPEGKQIKAQFNVVHKIRTLDQNAYYWVCCTAFAEDFGWNSAEEVHEFFKSLFLKKRYTLPTGEVCETVGSTTKLSTVEFSDYVDQCAQWCFHNADWSWPEPKHVEIQ